MRVRRVKCPICGMRFKVYEPASSVQIFCHKCGTLFEVSFTPYWVRVVARTTDEGGSVE